MTGEMVDIIEKIILFFKNHIWYFKNTSKKNKLMLIIK